MHAAKQLLCSYVRSQLYIILKVVYSLIRNYVRIIILHILYAVGYNSSLLEEKVFIFSSEKTTE